MPDDALRIVGSGEREDRRLALTPNAVIPRLTNSILLDAAGGFVGVLSGLSDLATFLCCFPFVGPDDRGDEGHCRLALNWGLIHSWCKLPSCDANIRARSKSTPARPYIARLRLFNLLICWKRWRRLIISGIDPRIRDRRLKAAELSLNGLAEVLQQMKAIGDLPRLRRALTRGLRKEKLDFREAPMSRQTVPS